MARFVLVLVAALLVLAPTNVAAQRALSIGIGAGLPAVNPDGQHGMLTLEARLGRLPLNFRADLSVADDALRGRVYQATGSVLVPFVDRAFAPYAVGGVAFGINQWVGGGQPGGEGLRAGLGLRYRVGQRVLFAENAYHWGFNRSLLTFGVQF